MSRQEERKDIVNSEEDDIKESSKKEVVMKKKNLFEKEEKEEHNEKESTPRKKIVKEKISIFEALMNSAGRKKEKDPNLEESRKKRGRKKKFELLKRKGDRNIADFMIDLKEVTKETDKDEIGSRKRKKNEQGEEETKERTENEEPGSCKKKLRFMRCTKIEDLREKEKEKGSVKERKEENALEEKERKKKVDSDQKDVGKVSRIRDEFEKKKTEMSLSRKKVGKKVPVQVLDRKKPQEGRNERNNGIFRFAKSMADSRGNEASNSRTGFSIKKIAEKGRENEPV